jgi:pilus assembly protein Flp/PilA
LNPAGDLPMACFFSRLIRDETGVTAIEYGLIAALIVIGSLVAVNSVSLNLNLQNTFSTVAANL